MKIIKFFKSKPIGKSLHSHVICSSYVRRHDYENYLAGLCIRDSVLKRMTFALRAFNVELATIKDKTTNSDRAKVRFHFWSKLIDEVIEKDCSEEKLQAYYKHTPVAKELFEAFEPVNFDEKSKENFRNLIGSRLSSKVLGYSNFQTLDELLLYCSKSNEPVYQLVWQSAYQIGIIPQIDSTTIERINRLTNRVGVAQGLSNVIRGIPYNSFKGSCFVPDELLKAYSLKHQDFRPSFKTKQLDTKKIKPVIIDMANLCQNLLNETQDDISSIPYLLRDLFLPRINIQSFLKRLRNCNYDICDKHLNQRNYLLPLNLWLNSKLYKFPVL